MKTKISTKVAYGGVLTALALIFSYVEALIPFNFGIYGMKLGLANLVIVVGLEIIGPIEVFIILICRILLASMMFGNAMSVIYSLGGGILSFIVMLILKKTNKTTVIQRSVLGGVFHNIGQIIVAIVVLSNINLVFYLPVLIVSGTVTGLIIGMLSYKLIPVVKNNINTRR